MRSDKSDIVDSGFPLYSEGLLGSLDEGVCRAEVWPWDGGNRLKALVLPSASSLLFPLASFLLSCQWVETGQDAWGREDSLQFPGTKLLEKQQWWRQAGWQEPRRAAEHL